MRNEEFANTITRRMEAIDALAEDLKRSAEQSRRLADEATCSTAAKDTNDLLLIRFGRLFDAYFHYLHSLLEEVAKEDISKILTSDDEVQELRKVRNAFVHSYLPEEQPCNYQTALERVPLLLGAIEKVRAYTRQLAGLPKVSLPPRRKSSSLEM